MLAIAVGLSGFLFAQSSMFRLGIPVDFSGMYTNTINDVDYRSTYVDAGYGISTEFLYPITSYFQIGWGLDIQAPRVLEDRRSSSFEFTSFYVNAKIMLPIEEVVSPYIISRVGLDFLTGNDDFSGDGSATIYGGLYTFGGAGIDIKMSESSLVFLEGGYALNNGSVEYDEVEIGISYAYFQARAGVSFNM
jgi:hypothetical protein